MFGKGSPYHLVQVGARITPLESLLVYSLPLFFLMSHFREWFTWNLVCQFTLFVPVVQLPAFITGHMAYVDIGWPSGLVLLAYNATTLGDGYWVRRWVTCGCMFLHGGRMALGAVALFYPYRWKQDLPRYRYAKERFMGQDGMPASMWPLKMQHDTLQQAFANTTVLACPLMLCAFDKTPSVSMLEVAGWLLWVLCWLWENVADGQKMAFLAECRKSKSKTAVLGHEPFNGAEYNLWTLCRHPNYFGEWMAWNAFILMSLPSLMRLEESLVIKAGLGLTLWFTSRFFYDCLNYWTGAEPAEHFSVQKRELYKDYQKNTRVFFPFEMPFVDHCRVSGWPHASKTE